MATTQNMFASLPPPAECLAILIGCAELSIFGIRGLSNPAGWLQGFGLPVLQSSGTTRDQTEASQSERSNSEDVHDAQRALVEALATRNIQNGVLILTFACFLRDRRALGIAVLAGLITTISDTLVTWRYGARNAVLGHLVGVANCAGIGGGLLLWGRQEVL